MSTITEAKPGDAVSFSGIQLTVMPSCDETRGQWVCITHQLTMPNAMMMTSHTEKRGSHLMAWLCPLHGLERGLEDE